MLVLMPTLGSHGDIHPFIAIGRELVLRGHRAVLATNPYFQAQVESADGGGVEFAALMRRDELRSIITRHRVMDPLWGPIAVLRTLVLPEVAGFVRRTRELIRELRPDVVVYHPIVIGVPWACELEGGVRAVSVSLSPLMWANPGDRSVLLPGRSHQPGAGAVRFDLAVGRWFMRLLMDPELNRIRGSLGLGRGRDHFHAACTGADLNLGAWSPVFRGPLAGDPARSRITGFCWHDRDHTQQAADGDLIRFLDAGPAPVVCALGSTGVHAAGRFYEHAVEACVRLGSRGLLVVGRDQPPPPNMPRDGSVLAVAYAPFSLVFPRASVVVHHGGAGTTAQALRAGRPTVITPMAHDQFDNAARVKRLGAGETLRFSRVSAAGLERVVGEVLGQPAHAGAAAALRSTLLSEDGAAGAAACIEKAGTGAG